ncbi:MAG: lipopolysaccharide heptosyltransferase II [Sulfurovum sp.]
MKIFIEIPSWLGDAVMTTPAIENIIVTYPNAKLIIFGSFVSTRLFLHHPNLSKIIVDDSKKEGFRYFNLYKLAKSVGDINLAFSFRQNFTTKYLLFFINSPYKYIYSRYTNNELHQVIRYNDFINHSLKMNTKPSSLKIYKSQITITKNRPILGINAGATYGSAKRWYPSEFAKVAIALSKQYDIILFGGAGEKPIVDEIEQLLIESNITAYQNLVGKTSVEELIAHISNLDLFITNDSGPMHIAGAFDIKTVAIFGPTKHIETHQWSNKNEIIIRKDMECSPCMKRVCPLNHHDCMKLIKAGDVLERINH